MDESYILVNVIQLITVLGVFFLSYNIFKNTKGASLAYKKWATGTFLMVIATSIFLLFGIFGCNDTSSRDISEFHRVLGSTFLGLGYFYVPLGVLYLSKDMDVGEINYNLIKKDKIFFIIILILLFVIFSSLVPLYKMIEIIVFTYGSLYIVVWFFTTYYYAKIYPILKNMSSCWTFLYLGIIGGILTGTDVILALLISGYFEFISLIGQLMMIVGFFIGFFKLAKVLDAI